MTVEWPITRYAVRYKTEENKPDVILGSYDKPGEAYSLLATLRTAGWKFTGIDPHIVSYQQSEYTRLTDDPHVEQI